MDNKLLSILVCPVCLGSLTFSIDNGKKGQPSGQNIMCIRCNRQFPINNGIPCMIPTDSFNKVISERNFWLGNEEKQLLTNINISTEHERVRSANASYYDFAANVYEEDVEQAVNQNPRNQERINTIIKIYAQFYTL